MRKKTASKDTPPSKFGSDVESEGSSDAKKKTKEEMADHVQALVQRQIEEAVQFYEENLEPEQVKATDYYYGRPFGDEVEGRSKVVSTDLRDTIAAMLPILIRIFLGPERVVEFRGRGPEDDDIAAQQTDHTNYIVREDNPAFLIFMALLKDMLVRRTGIVKWFWDKFNRVEEEELTGLSDDELSFLLSQPDVEPVEDSITRTPGEKGPNGEPAEELVNIRVQRKYTGGCEKYVAVPPEEFVYTPNARDLETAPLVCHVRNATVDELVELGISMDDIEEAQGERRARSSMNLEFARQYHAGAVQKDSSNALDESQQPVVYAEAYVLVDADQDKIAERRLFKCIGASYKITNGDGLGEIVDEVPFAVGTMDPEPHTIVGLSAYDFTKDIQRVKSQIQRETLNSLGAAVEPIKEVVEGKVNMKDILNPDVKGVIRVRAPGMVREITTTFVGPDTLPMLEYYDEILESRTGRNKGAMGIDADALQSSTKSAVSATLSASQQRIEMIARTFAETLMRPLFKGLLRLSVKHRDKERMIRMRGKYVSVDPRSWDATMDVHINVGIGQGMPEDRIEILKEIAAEMKEQLSLGSPLASWSKYRGILQKIVELGGWHVDEFFEPFTPDMEKQMQQQKSQQPPPPDPNMAIVQVQQSKVAADVQHNNDKLALEREKMMMQDARERERIANDLVLGELELHLKYHSQQTQAAVDAQVQHVQTAVNAHIDKTRIESEERQNSEAVAAQAATAQQQTEQPQGDAQ